MSTDIVEKSTPFSLAPKSIDEALRFAEMLSKSNLVPKEFGGNPGNILVAVQWGAELGLQPMQAMQNIAVINGRPSLWGDSVIALVKASPACEYVVEEATDEQATCRVKRKGEPEQTRVFTKADAQKAGLLNKQGPWSQYPKRMMQMRARSWALRDVFPDVLRGMPIAEEVMDIPGEKDITPKVTEKTERPEMPALTPDILEKQKPRILQALTAGTSTADAIIAKLQTKYVVDGAMQEAIHAMAIPEPTQTNDEWLAGYENGAPQ